MRYYHTAYGIKATHEPYLVRLIRAQGNHCAYCRHFMDPPGQAPGGRATMAASLDHVWPRRAPTPQLPRVRLHGRIGTYGNGLAVCEICNGRKGNRLPTGCELVWLELINARLRDPAAILARPWRRSPLRGPRYG